MTATTPTYTAPRQRVLDRKVAMKLAATEYQRCLQLLQSLAPDDWAEPTDCPDRDVRMVAAHILGMAEMAASIRESRRQVRAAEQRTASSSMRSPHCRSTSEAR